jgi:dihydrodipicolinate synthase/N-acetylneuraminate lyase
LPVQVRSRPPQRLPTEPFRLYFTVSVQSFPIARLPGSSKHGDQMSEFNGLFIPATTPFDPVTGDVALVHFRNNVRKWLEEPIDGFVLFGSTGEGVLIDDDEKTVLIESARELVPAGRKLVVGITADSTRAIVKKAHRFAQAGADAFLIAPPPYFGAYLSAAALADHYRAVADGSPAPILIYHIPKYTKVLLDPALVGELVRHGNIAGLKDSSGDLMRFADYTAACGGGCALFVGNGTLLYSALELGGSGGIVAIGQVAPQLCGEIVAAFRAGNVRRAGELQELATPLHREIVANYGAVGVKAALDMIGYYGGPPRRPLVALTEQERQPLARVMQETGVLTPAA